MPRKLYIGNLPMSLSEAELETALYDTCADFGMVEDLFIIKDKTTGEDRFKPVVRVDRLNLLSSRKESENNQYSNNSNSSEIPF